MPPPKNLGPRPETSGSDCTPSLPKFQTHQPVSISSGCAVPRAIPNILALAGQSGVDSLQVDGGSGDYSRMWLYTDVVLGNKTLGSSEFGLVPVLVIFHVQDLQAGATWTLSHLLRSCWLQPFPGLSEVRALDEALSQRTGQGSLQADRRSSTGGLYLLVRQLSPCRFAVMARDIAASVFSHPDSQGAPGASGNGSRLVILSSFDCRNPEQPHH